MMRKLTKKEILETFSPEERSFVRYVLENVDMDQMQDASRDPSLGWHGFIRYTELSRLLSRRRKSIQAILKRHALFTGASAVETLTRRLFLDDDEAAQVLYGPACKSDSYTVSLVCWLVLGLVAGEIHFELERRRSP